MKTVIEMAREVGAGEPESLYGRTDYVVMTKFELERFAELVRADAIADEREACAYKAGIAVLGADRGLANRVDKAIRARGNT